MHGKALQSFRKNDFDPHAAMAEVIDNSIQAMTKDGKLLPESGNIKIHIKFEVPEGKQKPIPHTIAFGDDGIGMSPEILQKCLVLGESTRENDRDGIGRFGVGMTNGAISLCKRIQVYSKPRQGNWNYVELDLDNLDATGAPFITFVEQKPELPNEFKHLVGENGTLVIWDKIDRIPISFNTPELNHWISRTFRKFIGEQIIELGKVVDNQNKISISITTVGEKDVTDETKVLEAFDPLYVIPSKNRPNDETAEIFNDWEVTMDVDDQMDPLNTKQKTGKIRFRFSFTPESWRKESGSGGSTENNARHIYENEGISILRNSREVSYDTIPHWVKQFVDKDRFWSCEIDFEAVLDAQFTVKNIKVGARPLHDTRELLQNEINPPRNTAISRLDAVWDAAKSKKISGGSVTKGHQNSKSKKKTTTTPKPLSAEEKKQQEEALKKKEISEEETKEILKQLQDPNTDDILIYDSLKADSKDDFMEIERLGGKTIVWLNANHPFFQSTYGGLKELNELAEKSEDPIKSKLIDTAAIFKSDLDNLIRSYTQTQNSLIKTEQEGTEESLEKLILNWSLSLRQLFDYS